MTSVLIAEGAAAQSYGLSAPVAVGPFLNGVMPPRTPQDPGSSQWDIATAFPNLPALPETLVMASTPSNNRLYVGSRAGSIVSFPVGPAVSGTSPFLDLTDRVAVVWDAGLLSMVFHPQFGQAGSPFRKYVYVYYASFCAIDSTRSTTDLGNCNPNFPADEGSESGFFGCYLRVSRFEVPDGSISADKSTEKVLFNIRLYNSSHRGGELAFGADGDLYLSIGDQFNQAWAQDIVSGLHGGVLRMAVSVTENADGTFTCPAGSHLPVLIYNTADEISGRHYCIPNDNPWLSPSGGNFEEYYAIGLRNPFRMSEDPATGRIWLGDVGESARDEIDVVLSGRNYGWPFREGLIAGPAPAPPSYLGILTDPVIDFTRDEANATIAGYVYRGTLYPDLVGKFLSGDDITGLIWAITLDDQTMTATKEQLAVFTPGGLGTWGQDSQGEVYLGSVAGTDPLYTIQRLTAPVPDPPALLSQLGVFANLSTLQPASYFVPYTVNPFWSDGAVKSRWIAVPNDGVRNTPAEQIGYVQSDNWSFPTGTVLMKHFELPIDQNHPNVTTRLETRFMVHGDDGNWYGLTYQWLPDQSDAVLLTTGATANYTIQLQGGGSTQQTWQFPSRIQCMQCHTQAAGGALGPRTHQINRSFTYPSTGITDNQLRTWNHLGMFSPALDESTIPGLLQSKLIDDVTASLEDRARGFLDSNCSQCHRPGTNNPAAFDARLTTPLSAQSLIWGPLQDDLGIAGAHVVTPGNILTSVLYQRDAALGSIAMPPLLKNVVDQPAVDVLGAWIQRVPPGYPHNGLAYQYWETDTSSITLAGFNYSNPTSTGEVVTFDISSARTPTDYVFRFSGYVQVDTGGTYTFYTTSDDGSQLFIDGALVVNNDGDHPSQQRSGTITLTPGYHSIVVTYFQWLVNASLTVQWQGPGISQGLIPTDHLFVTVPTTTVNHPPSLAPPTTVTSVAGGAPISIRPTASDPDGNSLYFGASGLPSGISIDPSTGAMSGVATTAGLYTVTVGVSDGPSATSGTFKWLVISPPTQCGLGAELAVVIPLLQVLRLRLRRSSLRRSRGSPT